MGSKKGGRESKPLTQARLDCFSAREFRKLIKDFAAGTEDVCSCAQALDQPLRVARWDREYGKLYEVSSFLKALA